MSVVCLDDKSLDNSSLDNEEIQLIEVNVSGIKELEALSIYEKSWNHKRSFDVTPVITSGLSENSESEDNSSIKIIDNIPFQKTPEKHKKTPIKSNTCSEGEFHSPEIPLIDSPKLFKISKNLMIIKTSMETRKAKTSKKLSHSDILAELNSDDENIFDSYDEQKSKTPEKNPVRNLRSRSGTLKTTIKYHKTVNNRKHFIAEPSYSSRVSIETPINEPHTLVEEESDDDFEKETKLLKTPKSSRKRNINKSKKNDSDHDQEIETPKKTRVQSQAQTPKSSVLTSVETPSGRLKRSTRLASKLVDYKNVEDENNTNKANQSDESDNDTRASRSKRKVVSRGSNMTPKTLVIKCDDAKTPRKLARKVDFEDISSTINEEPTTPKQRKRITKSMTPSARNKLTPSMRHRTVNVGKPQTALQEARAQLHVSAVPSSLPCREEEFNDIFTFLQRKLVDHISGCIYISGVPGTGKTATVNEVVRCLKKLVAREKLDSFEYLEINGMKLTEPRQAYTQIVKQMTGETMPWEPAYQMLEKKFSKSKGHRPMTLLLVDELDLLCNKRQDVVYNLLDWPAKQGAQLVVITIANTMDLPERVLMGRVTSRLGLTRLTFQPYDHKQLQEIVVARLKDSDAFRSEAIQLVARKVAAVSGDARRALDICRRATEIAEYRKAGTVSMQDVNDALSEMIASAKVQTIQHCSELEKVFLQAVCAEIDRTGVEETTFQKVYKQFDALCCFNGVKTPNTTLSLEICSRLSANRLLLCEHSRADILQRILLNVSPDDIHFALKNI